MKSKELIDFLEYNTDPDDEVYFYDSEGEINPIKIRTGFLYDHTIGLNFDNFMEQLESRFGEFKSTPKFKEILDKSEDIVIILCE